MRRPLAPLALALLAGLLTAAGRCYDSGDFSPTAPPTQDALTLTVVGSSSSIPADGVSRLRILAQIAPDAAPDRRTVVFSASAGTLIGGTAGADGTHAVAADLGGQASIELRSAQQVGDAVVTASIQGVAGVTRRLTVTFVAANPDAVLQFVAAPATAPADGASISSFTVRLAPALPAGTQVRFQATAGTFRPEGTSDVTRTADASFTVTADLAAAAAIGPARVTATAQNVSREATLQFVRALPNRIVVSTNGTFTVAPSVSQGITVAADLLRDVGTATPGSVVTFRATTDAGAALGFFRDATVSGTDGKATATYLAGETDYRGRVRITVGVEGSGVTGSTEISVVDPG